MVLQNYQNLIEVTSNMFHIIAFGVGFKCPRKIHLNTQCPGLQWCDQTLRRGGLRVMDKLTYYYRTLTRPILRVTS